MKLALFVSLIVAALAIPVSGVQMGPGGKALSYDIRINGTVYCPENNNIGASGTNNPVIPDAEIQVTCGGQMVSNATTNDNGGFVFYMDSQHYTVPIMLKNCNLLVFSPYIKSKCPNSPVGYLESLLKYIGDTIVGNLKIANISPVGFHIVP
ncbi:hypothetical protein ACB092_02G059400 [Castanea dentata]